MIILCGAGDRPCAQLGDKTPLEVANTPTLDWLARDGQQGSIRIIDDVIPPESDSGAMALLSYDPLQFYTGRGPLEGLGLGFNSLAQHSVSFRVNFASLDRESDRLDRRTARDLRDPELQALARAVRAEIDMRDYGDVGFKLMAFARHRGILCFFSDTQPISGNVSNTDPGFVRQGPFGVPVHHDNQPLSCEALDDAPATHESARLVNWFVERSSIVLAADPVNQKRVADGRLPANFLLFRDGGEEPRSMPSFTSRFGRTVSFYGQIPAEKGLMELIGGRFVSARRKADEDTPDYHSELAESMAADEADIVMVHLKGIDEHGHDGSAVGKISGIEMIDREFLAPLVRKMRPSDRVIVTCDHATPCELQLHSADNVPALAFGEGIVPDETRKFCEAQSLSGALSSRHATELLREVLSISEPAT